MTIYDLVFLDSMGTALPTHRGFAFIKSEFQSWVVKPRESGTFRRIFAEQNGTAVELWEVGDQFRLTTHIRGQAGVLTLYADQSLTTELTPKLFVEPSLLNNEEYLSILEVLGRLAEGLQSYLTVPCELLESKDFESYFSSLAPNFEDELLKLHAIRSRILALLKSLHLNPIGTIELARREVDLARQTLDSRLVQSISIARGRRRLLGPTKSSAPNRTDINALLGLLDVVNLRIEVLKDGILPSLRTSRHISMKSSKANSQQPRSTTKMTENISAQLHPIRGRDRSISLNPILLALRRDLGTTQALQKFRGFPIFSASSRMPVERSSKLYEKWCTAAFAIGLKYRGFDLVSDPEEVARFVQSLRKRYDSMSNDGIEYPSFTFEKKVGDDFLRVTIRHEPPMKKVRASPATDADHSQVAGNTDDLTPDLVVEATLGAEHQLWIFDAKYKDFSHPDEKNMDFRSIMSNTIDQKYRFCLGSDVAVMLHPSESFVDWDDDLSRPDRLSTAIGDPYTLLSISFTPKNEVQVVTALLTVLLYQRMNLRKEGMFCCHCGGPLIFLSAQVGDEQLYARIAVCDLCYFVVGWLVCTCKRQYFLHPKGLGPSSKLVGKPSFARWQSSAIPKLYGNCPCGR